MFFCLVCFSMVLLGANPLDILRRWFIPYTYSFLDPLDARCLDVGAPNMTTATTVQGYCNLSHGD